MKVVGPDGVTAFEGTVSERSSAVFDVPPGRVTLTSSVEDSAAQKIDSDIRDVVVREIRGAIALGTPEVFRARTARDLRELRADTAPVPVASREFSRTEHLMIRVPGYALGEAPFVSATLVSPAKQEMRHLEVEQASGSSLFAHVDLPLAGLAPGQYSINITAGPAGEAEEILSIRVTN